MAGGESRGLGTPLLRQLNQTKEEDSNVTKKKVAGAPLARIKVNIQVVRLTSPAPAWCLRRMGVTSVQFRHTHNLIGTRGKCRQNTRAGLKTADKPSESVEESDSLKGHGILRNGMRSRLKRYWGEMHTGFWIRS